jgi:hypothetical protein
MAMSPTVPIQGPCPIRLMESGANAVRLFESATHEKQDGQKGHP